MKKVTILFITLIFGFSLTGANEPVPCGNGVSPPPPKDGAVLLDSLVVGFNKLAVSGKGGYEEVNKLLQDNMRQLKKAWDEEQVDPVFYHRYQRMLEVFKLAIMSFRDDPEGILNRIIGRELSNFVYDITGASRDFSAPDSRGIGAIAQALMYEILNLHIYLDTRDRRTELMKKYFRVLPPPPARKKK